LADIYRTLGVEGAWRPISLSPQRTVHSLLALAPAATIFLSCLSLSSSHRRIALGSVVAMAMLSLGIGLIQMLAGPESSAYFYPTSNTEAPIGFFSNRNHQAVFLTCISPIVAALLARSEAIQTRNIAGLFIASAVVMAAVGGAAAQGSRAATLLLVPSLLGSGVIVADTLNLSRRGRIVLIVALLSVPMVLMGLISA
jgi:hypothetical protein